MSGSGRVAVVTGASSGFGEATARRLAAEGFEVVVGARREERLRRLVGEIGGRWRRLDVTDSASVEAFAAALERVDVLVNNAGNAFGMEKIAEADEGEWLAMFELNVLGVMRMTRALLPSLVASGAADWNDVTNANMNHNGIRGGAPNYCVTCHLSSAPYLAPGIRKSSHNGASTAKDCSSSSCHRPLGTKGVTYQSWD